MNYLKNTGQYVQLVRLFKQQITNIDRTRLKLIFLIEIDNGIEEYILKP